jgi:hypothetical protein
VAQVLEYLCSKHEALKPSAAKKKILKNLRLIIQIGHLNLFYLAMNIIQINFLS